MNVSEPLTGICGCCVQLNTLRGSIIEDAVPSTSKHGLARGLPLKEVLEYLVPELNVHCLRLALNTPKVTDQLMKLDEQGVRRHTRSAREGAFLKRGQRPFLLGWVLIELICM